MHRHLVVVSLLLIPRAIHGQTPNAELARQVVAAESSFAATLANRDVAAFATFVAPDAIFFGQEGATRGKAAVVESWRGLFTTPKPPFSWKPAVVEVLDNGTLALSSGPVFNPDGKQTATFNSIWRREPGGEWKVVFDKGCRACACAEPPH